MPSICNSGQWNLPEQEAPLNNALGKPEFTLVTLLKESFLSHVYSNTVVGGVSHFSSGEGGIR